jgi:choline kinase
MNSKVLYLDGDLIIDPASLRSFVSRGAEGPLLIGVTRAKSSQAVFVAIPDRNVMKPTMINAFQRDAATPWEWANVFIGSPELLKAGTRYVYECIEPFLPCAAQMIDLHEVDTPEDLEQAKAWLQSHSNCTTV